MNKSMRFKMLACGVLAMSALTLAAAEGNKFWGASVTVGDEYTDNRDGLHTNKTSNNNVTITPRVELKYKNERTALMLYYAPSWLLRSNPRQSPEPDPQHRSDFYQAVGFDGSHSLDRVQLKLKEFFATADDPQITEGGAAVRQNGSYLYNRVDGEVDANLTERASLGLAGGNSVKRYNDDAVAQEEDEDTYNGDLTGKYLLGEQFFGVGHVQYAQFNNTSTNVERGAKIMTYDLGLEKRFSPNIRAKASGGFQAVNYDNALIDDDQGPYVGGEFGFSQGGTRVNLAASYGFFGPYVRPYSAQKRTLVQLAVERDMTPSIILGVSGEYGRGDYDAEQVSATQTLPSGYDTLWNGKVRGVYKVNQYLSFELGYSYENWVSTLREEFQRNTFSLSMTAGI